MLFLMMSFFPHQLISYYTHKNWLTHFVQQNTINHDLKEAPSPPPLMDKFPGNSRFFLGGGQASLTILISSSSTENVPIHIIIATIRILTINKINIMMTMLRAIVVHAGVDDLGQGGASDSLTTGNAGARLVVIIIIRMNIRFNENLETVERRATLGPGWSS